MASISLRYRLFPLSSISPSSFIWPLCIILFVVVNVKTFDTNVYGIVRISEKNITAYNNRNLTIECNVDLSNRSDEKPSFTINGRMVLTFMTVPRQLKPLHQMQSFLHCYDPARMKCRAEFNLDLSCLEDQMNRTYFYNLPSYIVEAACQVDDKVVCSSHWMARFPFDCYDLGQINVINAPRLGEKCLFLHDNSSLECGENQVCNIKYGICMCQRGYAAANQRCLKLNDEIELPLITDRTTSSSTYTTDNSDNNNNHDDVNNGNGLVNADSSGTFKAIVIFLLVLAILLCIALGIVIIWSRHYRHLLDDVSA